MKIQFKEFITLTLEGKTNSNYEEERFFSKGEIVEVEGVDLSDSGPWVDIYLPKETGWVARGVLATTFEVLS